MRETTERPEGVEAGTARLVGTSRDRIVEETERLLHDRRAYEQMARAHNPYGDGRAGARIAEVLAEAHLEETRRTSGRGRGAGIGGARA
jgi:UDP-N-acetylglucosamine 2-epimerase (non-hydrolysing)